VEAARQDPLDPVAAPHQLAGRCNVRTDAARNAWVRFEVGAADVVLAETLVPGEQRGWVAPSKAMSRNRTR
jgi:hypothetical protein